MQLQQARYWIHIALFNFLLAAIAGLIMRYAFFGEINWISFKDLLQAHSHMAMLGWVFLALVILIIHYFEIKDNRWRKLLLIAEFAVVGMFISFLLVGYASYSIFFLSIHMILAGIIVWIIYKQIINSTDNTSWSKTWLKSSFFFLLLSFIGPLALGPIAMMGLRGSALYYAAIQFFLHFQFNGWMIFGLVALLYKFLEKNNIEYSYKLTNVFHKLLVASCFLTYALAIAWSNPYLSVFLINSVGVILQLGALVVFMLIIFKLLPDFKARINPQLYWLFVLAFLMLAAKIGIQSFIVIPFVAKIAYTIRLFVIGFIHLILLGAVSLSVLAFTNQAGVLSNNNVSGKTGIKIFAIGFILTEMWMFIQGILLWARKGFIANYNEILFCLSTLLIIGLIVMLSTSILFTQKKSQPELNLQRANHIKKINKN